MDNLITTWQQGYFVDQPQYDHMSDDEKQMHDKVEKHFVRPSPTGNAICHCPMPDDAKWIDGRLNLAAQLEQMTYDYATGKSDGSEIVALVKKNIEAI